MHDLYQITPKPVISNRCTLDSYSLGSSLRLRDWLMNEKEARVTLRHDADGAVRVGGTLHFVPSRLCDFV